MSLWLTNFDVRDTPAVDEEIQAFITTQMQALKNLDERRIAWAAEHLPADYEVNYLFYDHSYRVANNMKNAALYMELGTLAAENLYWATLPHDIGKTALPLEIWDIEGKPNGELKTQRRTHTRTGVAIVERELGHIHHPFKDLMLDIMLNHHEKMDGTGQNGVGGDALSLPVRLACIADSFDGWRVRRPHYAEDRDTSIPGVMTRLREEKGAEFFDMDLVEIFERMKMAEYNSAS